MTERDLVRVRGMRFWGKHGVAAAERERAQPVDVDIELVVDCAPAAASDDLVKAVDYDRIYRACERIVTQQSFNLLETLADACLAAAFEDPRVIGGTIRVSKPRLLEGATPEVQLTRPNPRAQTSM